VVALSATLASLSLPDFVELADTPCSFQVDQRVENHDAPRSADARVEGPRAEDQHWRAAKPFSRDFDSSLAVQSAMPRQGRQGLTEEDGLAMLFLLVKNPQQALNFFKQVKVTLREK